MTVSENIAEEYYHNGEYEKALKLYLELAEKFSRNEDYQICCGNCLDISGDKKLACHHYLKAYKINKRSLPALINLSTSYYEIGDLKSAEKYCRKALIIDSENISILINLGNIYYQKKAYRTAMEYYQKAAVVDPNSFMVEVNLANTFFDLKEYAQSLKHAKRSTELNPSSSTAWSLMGNAALETDHFETANMAFLQAAKLAPEDPWIYNALSQVYQKKSRWEDALKNGWLAVEKSNGNDAQQINFGYLLYEASIEKQDSLCRQYVDSWLIKYPQNPIVSHVVNAFENDRVPDIANPTYVQNIFDVFAPDFEQVLTGLEYRAPELISGFLSEFYGKQPSSKMRILDAGCGTGLCGKFLKKYASWRGLDGVDLSVGMLKEAKTKKLYSRLFQEELVCYLQKTESKYDLIVSADVLTYIGDLEKLFFAARHSLKNKGRVIFTVSENSLNDGDWFLHVSGRFLHRREYVEKMLQKTGFGLEKISREKLRNEGDSEVMGYVVSAQKNRR